MIIRCVDYADKKGGFMRRIDYLNPVDMRSQCMKAAERIESDCRTLLFIRNCIDNFIVDPEIESVAFAALKQQLGDYHIIIEAMQIANDADAADYRSLAGFVGDEVLDGEVIYCQMENALRMKDSYLSNETLYRDRMKTAEDPFFYVYYQWKADQYSRLAENSQRLYEKWYEKTEKFDEIVNNTNHLFTDSESIRVLIRQGMAETASAFQNGSYSMRENSTWRRQIMNAGVRLAMCYEDKGGDQNGPYTLWWKGAASDREYIRDIVHGYEEYADYSDEEVTQLLMKLNSEGCGYVAFANMIVDEYRRKEEEFERMFGFPLFLQDVNGDTYVDYNRLIIDLYCASDNHNEAGNLWKKYDVYDAAEDLSAANGRGTTPEDRIYRFERYMDAHGAKVEIDNIECDTGNVYQKCGEEAAKGNRVLISTCPVRLEDAEGEPAQMDGGHAMAVTGLTEDGKIEVSSWGEKYYITPEDTDYTAPEKNRSGNAYIRIQSVRFG